MNQDLEGHCPQAQYDTELDCPLLTNEAASRYLGIAPGSLQNMRWKKMGPSYIKIGCWAS